MTQVQYMRPYSPEELAEFNDKVRAVFDGQPGLVALGVLAIELQCLLRGDEETARHAPPAVIAELIASLEKAVPYLAGQCVLGLSREESVS